MDLTPKSYKDPTPYFSSTFCPHPSTHPSIYPTPPQSCEHTDLVQPRSPVIPGLGIISCNLQSPSGQVTIGHSPQTLLPLTQCWTQGPTSSGCFSDTSPSLPNYTGLNLYDDLDALSTSATSPFPVTSSQPETPHPLAFLPSQQVSRPSNAGVQSTPIFNDFDLGGRLAPVTGAQLSMVSQAMSTTTTPNSLKRPFQGDNLTYQQPLTSVPFNFRNASGILHPNLNNANINDGGMLGSSMPTVACNTATNYNEPPRKQRKRANAATAKYRCDICGMSFTRNSNCKSHMKIHDPNRKYPHKCMYANCTKKFSRKTDLVRHIDSVHKRLKNFVCDQCGHGFARQDTLKRHCEDGCRRQQRLSQHSHPGTMIPVSLQHAQPYQQPLPQLAAWKAPAGRAYNPKPELHSVKGLGQQRSLQNFRDFKGGI